MSTSVDGLSRGCAGLGTNGRSGNKQSAMSFIPRLGVTGGVTGGVTVTTPDGGIAGCEVRRDDTVAETLVVIMTVASELFIAFFKSQL